MKRYCLIVSMLACLLLCGCSTAPLSQPPDDSLMIEGAVVMLEQRQVTYKGINTVRYGGSAEYYKLLLEHGVETVGTYTPKSGVDYSELPYKHYAALLDTLVAHLQQDAMGMSDLREGLFISYYSRGSNGMNQYFAGKAPDAADKRLRYIGYYVYSISQKTLTRGDGNIMGEDRWGYLSVYNHNPFAVSKNDQKLEECYVLIGD